MKAVLNTGEAQALLQASIDGELPDERGRFGPFGGRYVPETLVPAFERLEKGIAEHLHSEDFQKEFRAQLRGWVGRPTALTFAPRLSERWGTEVWDRASATCKTTRRKKNHRRNRRWSAWRRVCCSLCACWIAVPRVHGCRRYKETSAKRRPHASPWRRSYTR